MKNCLLACVLIVLGVLMVKAQTTTTGDVLGMHDLSLSGTSPIKGGLPPCLFCHAPHSGQGNVHSLWSEQLSTVTNYTLYQGTTNPTQQPALGSASNLCLSCHDGTVAAGQSVQRTTPYGNIQMQGSMLSQDVFGTDLQSMHPFNFKVPLDPSTPNLVDSVIAGTGTGNPAVKLIDGNVQCTSCHEPHNQNIDPNNQMFLVVDNTDSALCLACHKSTPATTAATAAAKTTTTARTPSLIAGSSDATTVMTRGVKPTQTATVAPDKPQNAALASCSTSIHAVASHKVGKGASVGNYGTVGRNGCMSCHRPHNATGGKGLLTGPSPAIPNLDATTQNCASCHNGGTRISPAIPNIFTEFAKNGHPFPSGTNTHTPGESVVLNNNRHATCVDCHNPHASRHTDSGATAATLRGSQYGVKGVSGMDGTSAVAAASNQYETCLRCHGTSTGKQTLTKYGYLPARVVSGGDPLNLILQFNRAATSSHPVMQDRSSTLSQPSLLQYMWNQDGKAQGRAMGTRLLCTDCHNSDDNREFGGSGANGPHGSQYPHILERRYEMSQVAPAAGPGSTIQNLFPNPVLDPACASNPCVSPYALCAKCHDLNKVMANTSFSQHARHINDGFSCSTCHTAHGLAATAASVSGERLVNFDANVVGSNGGAPISYLRAKNTCVLACHGTNHNPTGKVSTVVVNRSQVLNPQVRQR